MTLYEVYQTIKEHPGITTGELCARLGYSSDVINKKVRKLAVMGYVIRIRKQGKYGKNYHYVFAEFPQWSKRIPPEILNKMGEIYKILRKTVKNPIEIAKIQQKIKEIVERKWEVSVNTVIKCVGQTVFKCPIPKNKRTANIKCLFSQFQQIPAECKTCRCLKYFDEATPPKVKEFLREAGVISK